MSKNRVLVVAAHPDDEVLGCGGTIACHIRKKDKVSVLILGEGVTSREKGRKLTKKIKREIKILKSQALKAHKILGIKKSFFSNLPDNRFDQVPLLKIIKKIEAVKRKARPHIIYTHFCQDLNLDHQITYQAVITATRPFPEERVKELYSFEILSSTEWNYPLTFSPDVFVDISKTIKLKLKAMNRYKNELRKFPHPRSLKGIELNAGYWGMKVGLGYAEAFKTIRIVK